MVKKETQIDPVSEAKIRVQNREAIKQSGYALLALGLAFAFGTTIVDISPGIDSFATKVSVLASAAIVLNGVTHVLKAKRYEKKKQ